MRLIAMHDYIWKKIPTPKWEPVSFAATCVHEDNLYLCGGWNPITNSFNSQVWKTNHNFQWENIFAKSPWSPRNGHSLTFFKDKLYLIGGFNYKSKYLNEVWTLNLDNPGRERKWIQHSIPWEGREGHKAIIFRDSLWIYGGITKSGIKNDIWSSKNGIDWEGDFEIPPWSPRCFHTIQLYNNKLWLIAGSSSIRTNNDMYVSTNGINWKEYDSDLPFSPRFGSGAAVFDDKIWLIGGSDGEERKFNNDVWWFTEENKWNKLPIESPWTPRWGFNCVNVQNNVLTLLCGGVRNLDRKYSAFADGWALYKIL
jgi:N-acetylneuraminic acid mutarotase